MKHKHLKTLYEEARLDAKITLHEATIKGRRAEHYHIRRAAREWIKHIIALVIIAILALVIIIATIISKIRG
jgi:hypothetical protein